MRMLQFFLSITPNYHIFKATEYVSLKILSDAYVDQLTALNVLKLTYEDADKLNEYIEIEKRIKQKNLALINKNIAVMKKYLPYKVPYTTIQEAAQHYVSSIKLEKRDD